MDTSFAEAQQPPPFEAGGGCDPRINDGSLSLVEMEEWEVKMLGITIYCHLDILHFTYSIIYNLMVQKFHLSG